MARHSELIARRNADIRKQYAELRKRKEGRKPKYTAEYVVTVLADRFYLSERRIEDILWKTTG